MKCKCDDCGVILDQELIIPLADVVDLGERLDEGSVVPHGECPECGAFMYKHDEQQDSSYPYPEHAKLKQISTQSQACGSFVEWLEEKQYIEIKARKQLQSLLAEFFEIDENKLEDEKNAMLAECRKLHETKDTENQKKEA